MAAANRVRALKQKRSSLKLQITSLTEFLTTQQEGETVDKIQLDLRFKKLQTIFDGFEAVHDDLQLLDQNNEHEAEKTAIENDYFALATRIHKILHPIANPDDTINSNRTQTTEAIERSLTQTRRVKLPPVPLPSFSGKYEEWISFKDSFESMIDQDTGLSQVQKLYYLKSAVTGDASRKIDIFSMRNENYTEAWDLLKKSYDNKRLIISRHLGLLLALPKVETESHDGICKLADHTQQHMKSLTNLGVEVSPEIVVRILEERLPKAIASKWDETLKTNEFPKLEDLIEFLYRTAARLSMSSNIAQNPVGNPKRQQVQSYKFQPPNKRPRFDNKHNTLMTTVSKNCIVCAEKYHPLFKCEKFRKLPVPGRSKIVKDAGLCGNCLRDHSGKECTFGKCLICNKGHNTLLHIPKPTTTDIQTRA